AQLRPRQDLPLVDKRRPSRPQDLAHRVPRHPQIPRNLSNRLAFEKMLPPNPANRLHRQHASPARSESEASSATDQDSGGQFWTPIPQLRGSKLHAELHHKTQRIRRWFAKRPHWHVHLTPTGASWLNQVERFFALLTERQIKRGVHRSVTALEAVINNFINHHNHSPKPFAWTKKADDILASIERFCTRTLAVQNAKNF